MYNKEYRQSLQVMRNREIILKDLPVETSKKKKVLGESKERLQLICR